MNDELHFDLPDRKGKITSRQSPLLVVILAVLLALAMGVDAILALKQPDSMSRSDNAALSADAQQQLALKLEEQGLNTTAAEAWKEYLAIANPDQKETATIWYRIGKLYQANHAYEQALESYYRSESIETVDSIVTDMGMRVEECLEALGKYAALRHELSNRVDISSDAEKSGTNDQVVVEIGPQKITVADLDRRIEMSIDAQLSRLASSLPEDERNKQKAAMLKQFSTSSNRVMFLNQFIAQDLLYREARENNLTDDQKVRELLNEQERSLLAGLMLDKELDDQIKITSGDLTTYYEAHKADYVQPERIRVAHILVPDEQAAANVQQRLTNGESFEDLAKEVSEDTSTRENGGEIQRWIERTSVSIPELGDAPGVIDQIFATDAGSVVNKPIQSDKGFEIVKVLTHEQQRQQTFEDVKQDVYTALRSQKEQEVQQNLLGSLKEKHDVVIHQSAFAPEKPGNADEKTK
jgi:parvulin-like peptidyl-prolyl isomerase